MKKKTKPTLHFLPEWIVRIKEDPTDVKKTRCTLQTLESVEAVRTRLALGMVAGSHDPLERGGAGLFARALPGAYAPCVSSPGCEPRPSCPRLPAQTPVFLAWSHLGATWCFFSEQVIIKCVTKYGWCLQSGSRASIHQSKAHPPHSRSLAEPVPQPTPGAPSATR